jgi:hypothetical protein
MILLKENIFILWVCNGRRRPEFGTGIRVSIADGAVSRRAGLHFLC